MKCPVVGTASQKLRGGRNVPGGPGWEGFGEEEGRNVNETGVTV